ncbi:MAG: alpha/beta hydrolase [Pseudomonadota bacterium]
MAEIFEDKSWSSEDGLNLHYRDYPARSSDAHALPVICLHGLTRNARDFEGLAVHLSETRRVIVPDMRGRGKSDYAPSSETYKPKQYVADVELLLAETGISRFISVGTSMGGIMTMLLAANDPERIAGVVLNDIGPEIETAGLDRIGGYVGQGKSFPTWVHAARSLQETHGDAFPDYELDQWLELAKRFMVVSQNGRISFDYDMAIAEPFSDAGNAAPPNLWLAFEALRDVPMLLVRGALSDLISDETIRQMKARNPAMTTITVPRVGHAPTLDETEVRSAIDALLASLA